MIAELNGRPPEAGELASLGLYNYGHFTSLLVNGARVKGLGLHLDRLVSDCRTLFAQELDRDEIRRLLGRVAARITQPLVMRVTVFDPALELGRPGADLRPRILITTRREPGPDITPLTLSAAEHVRTLPSVKHVGLFATIVHRRKAQRDGYDDVVYHDTGGRLSEGTTWNIGFIDGNGGIVVPDQPCLPGVTMRLMTDALDRHDIDWRYEQIKLTDVSRMTAGFAMNAAVGVRAIARLAEHRLDVAHPRLSDLRELYAGIAADAI